MKAFKKFAFGKKHEDEVWKSLKKQFEAHVDECAKIGKGVQKHRACLEQFVPSLLLVAESFTQFYQDTDDEHRGRAKRYHSTATGINQAMGAYSRSAQEIDTNLKEYQKILKLTKKRMQERDKLLSAYEKASSEHASLQQKQGVLSSRLLAAEEAYASSKQSFETMDANVKAELTELLRSRYAQFEAEFQALVSAQYRLFHSGEGGGGAGDAVRPMAQRSVTTTLQSGPSKPLPAPAREDPSAGYYQNPAPAPVYQQQQAPAPVYQQQAAAPPAYQQAPPSYQADQHQALLEQQQRLAQLQMQQQQLQQQPSSSSSFQQGAYPSAQYPGYAMPQKPLPSPGAVPRQPMPAPSYSAYPSKPLPRPQ